jgi:hypothetical protein
LHYRYTQWYNADTGHYVFHSEVNVKPINVVLDEDALAIVLANASERKKGEWIGRLIVLAARLPAATPTELCEIVGEIEQMVAKRSAG